MGRKRVLGKLTDFISGREITDTDDERLRQRIAIFLVGEKGYKKNEILSKQKIEFEIDGEKIISMIDFVVRVDGIFFLVIRYGPGSLVTRERPALSSARILKEYQVPFTIVTNGVDAEVLDTLSGEVKGTGLEFIPDRETAVNSLKEITLKGLSGKRLEAEKRILSAYDFVEHSLECDDDWCQG